MSAEYEPLKTSPLPTNELFSVEYPGYVKNIDKVFRTLGGQHALNKAVNDEPGVLELHFRPGDPFSHPINGDVVATTNLLLKVTRRRRKKNAVDMEVDRSEHDPDVSYQDEGNAGGFEAEIVGLITKTCRFRAMADYQYVVDSTDSVPKLRRAMQTGDIKAITSFSLSTDDEDHSNLRNIPPPSFSRIEIPMNYGYRQNSAVVKVKIQRGDGQPPVIKLINRRKRKKFLVLSIDYETKDAPTGPPADVSRHQQGISDTSLQRVKELFERRPIWTRLALHNNLHPEDRPCMKKFLPFVAYLMISGPWRDCWVKYEVDPRKDREMRIYQLLDVRSTAKPRSFARAKRTTHVRPETTLGQEVVGGEGDSEEESRVKKSAPDESHLFDGKTRPRDTAIFQLCDISDPQLRPLIDTKDHLNAKCNKEDGWYDHSIVQRLRRIIRRKFTDLHNDRVPQEQDYQELVERLDADENEDEEEANRAGDEEGAEVGGVAGRVGKDGVSGKVEELMRNLQRAQQQAQDFDGEFEQEFPIEEVDEYEDVLGEEEEEEEDVDD